MGLKVDCGWVEIGLEGEWLTGGPLVEECRGTCKVDSVCSLSR